MRSLIATLFWLLSGSSCSVVFAVDYRLSGPVKCGDSSRAPSCGADATLSDAQHSFDKEKGNITKCLAQRSTKSDGPSLERLLSHDTCSRMTLAVLKNLCDEEKTVGGEDGYFWAPANQFKNGTATLQILLSMAKEGRPHDGHIIIGSTESTVKETHLALCEVYSVGGNTGPPRACVTVAIITPSTTWLRGGYSDGFCNAMAIVRPTGAIDILFEVITPNRVDAFLPALSKMMTGMGLAFEVLAGAKDRLRIRSAAGLRNSAVLQAGWREAMDFDVDLDRENDRILVNGVAHVMVARQALGNLDQYQGLDDAQRAIYATTFDSKVRAALKSACKSVVERDAKTLTCN